MSCFGKRVDVPGGQRRAERQPVCLLGSAVAICGSKSILVEDLCATGAKLLGRGLPPAGANLIILADRLDAFGRIIWASGDHRGVVFEAVEA